MSMAIGHCTRRRACYIVSGMSVLENGVAPGAWLDGDCFHVEIGGKKWRLAREASLDELWDAMGADDFADERIPYWTELWPASLALGAWLARVSAEIKDRLCLDIGCGLGLTALIGQSCGANMLAMDYELAPLGFCRRNAALNNVSQPAWLCMDWRAPGLAPHSIWRAWGADVLYERRFAQPVLDFLAYVLKPGGKAWLAEPGRPIFNFFLDMARDLGWETTIVFEQDVNGANPPGVSTRGRVWEVKHGI